jgi:hypothetical protein
MRYSDLIESPEDDLSQVQEADKIIRHLAKFFSGANEEKSIEEIYWARNTSLGNNRRGYFLSGYAIGLEEYSDLSIGFAWNIYPDLDDATEGAVARGSDGGRPHYWVYALMDYEELKKPGLGWRMDYNVLHHEVIHYLDYRRITAGNRDYHRQRSLTLNRRKKIEDPKRKYDSYFNDALERNAYYQMAWREILQSLTSAAIPENSTEEDRANYKRDVLGSFDVFMKHFRSEFRYAFMSRITPKNKARFMRRMYKAYVYIAEAWPNTDVVVAGIERMRKIWAELDLKDAAEEAKLAA